MKDVTGYLVSSGGGALIRVKIGEHCCNRRIQRMKESAMPDQKFLCIPEAAQAN